MPAMAPTRAERASSCRSWRRQAPSCPGAGTAADGVGRILPATGHATEERACRIRTCRTPHADQIALGWREVWERLIAQNGHYVGVRQRGALYTTCAILGVRRPLISGDDAE